MIFFDATCISTTQGSEGFNQAVSVTEELLDQAPAVTETRSSNACVADTQQAQKEWLSTTQESKGLNKAVSVTEELLDQPPAVTETRSSNACEDALSRLKKNGYLQLKNPRALTSYRGTSRPGTCYDGSDVPVNPCFTSENL